MKYMYQYKLKFQLENNILTKHMDKLFLSFLKCAAQSYSQEFYDTLYDKSRSIVKSYTFSYYLPGAVFQGENIMLVDDQFFVFFSDADQAELLRFFNAFQMMKFKKYPMSANSMQLTSISMQQLNLIEENEIVVKMQSPLLVREHHAEDNSDIYYTCEMDGFANALKDNVSIFVQKLGLNVPTDDFSIQVVKGKKIVIPVFGRNTDASMGIYKLTGSCELLNILYLAGLGSRRSEGRGKFDIIG